MSKSIALSLLAQGSTGSELLSILDVLAAESSDTPADEDRTPVTPTAF